MDTFNKKYNELKKLFIEQVKEDVMKDMDRAINIMQEKRNNRLQNFREQLKSKSNEQKQKEFENFCNTPKTNDINTCKTLNVDKIKTIKDIKDVLRVLNITIQYDNNYSKEQLEIIDRLFD